MVLNGQYNKCQFGILFSRRHISTFMPAPKFRPDRSFAARHHSATDIAFCWRYAPCASASASSTSGRTAFEGRAADCHMAGGESCTGSTKQTSKIVAARFGGSGGAGVICLAGAIHFTGGNTGEPNLRTFGAPYWAVPVIDRDGGA